jgi:hypothetical protein
VILLNRDKSSDLHIDSLLPVSLSLDHCSETCQVSTIDERRLNPKGQGRSRDDR